MTEFPDLPRRQRAVASVSITAARLGRTTRVVHMGESGSARLRLPRVGGAALEAVTINTGGGITGGDIFRAEAVALEGAELVVTSAAAEKIYRSHGPAARVETVLRAGPDARLEWLPQEAILFDRARLERRLDVEMDGTAAVFLFEATVFGRVASREVVREGVFRDRWRVRRDGILIYADTFRLAGDIAARLAHPAVAGGARAVATALYVAPDAEARIEEARASLEGAGSECGASAWNGLLAMRWLAPDIATLRTDAARFMTAFRGRPLPRVWHT